MNSKKNKLEINHSNHHDDALNAAFLSTKYVVFHPSQDINITIGQNTPELDDLLYDQSTWAYITAWNPNANLLSLATNKERNTGLLHDIISYNYPYYKGIGIGDDEGNGAWSEESFLVIGISLENAIKLAIKYDQVAFVFGSINEGQGLFTLNF